MYSSQAIHYSKVQYMLHCCLMLHRTKRVYCTMWSSFNTLAGPVKAYLPQPLDSSIFRTKWKSGKGTLEMVPSPSTAGMNACVHACCVGVCVCVCLFVRVCKRCYVCLHKCKHPKQTVHTPSLCCMGCLSNPNCLPAQWWVRSNRDVHHHLPAHWETQDRGSDRRFPGCQGPSSAAAGSGSISSKSHTGTLISTPVTCYLIPSYTSSYMLPPSLAFSQEQYEFCYKALLEYLNAFETYANFNWNGISHHQRTSDFKSEFSCESFSWFVHVQKVIF